MHSDTKKYNKAQATGDRAICNLLAAEIDRALPDAENKVWHAHPVWFLNGNPIVGYSKLKNCVRLLFWSGQSFRAKGLKKEGSFKAAEARYTSRDQVDVERLMEWVAEARQVQWDYKNLVRRKGRLERVKTADSPLVKTAERVGRVLGRTAAKLDRVKAVVKKMRKPAPPSMPKKNGRRGQAGQDSGRVEAAQA
jgi:hypothetical protein